MQSRQNSLAATLDSCFHPWTIFRRTSKTSVRRVLAGRALHLTVRRRARMGKYLDLEVHAVPLAVDGRVRGSYTIYKDISEQIKASEAERKHARIAEPTGDGVTASHPADESLLNEMGDLLECLRNHQEACAVVAQSVQKLLPRLFPEPLPVSSHRGTWWRPPSSGGTRDFRRHCSLPTPAGACAAASLTGTNQRGRRELQRIWLQPSSTNACACPWSDTGRHAGNPASRVCQ